jgi:hypothetical protein
METSRLPRFDWKLSEPETPEGLTGAMIPISLPGRHCRMSVSSDATITLTSGSMAGSRASLNASALSGEAWSNPLLDWRGISPATGADCSAVAWSSRMFSLLRPTGSLLKGRPARSGPSAFSFLIRGPTPYRGERIACLADHRGVNVWPDVHNPTLRWLNANPVGAPVRSLLIAAIVEIALLNSTHVIALHTASSLASRWVPYVLARAKAPGVTSVQAAGWFEDPKKPLRHGDYVQLGAMLFDEQGVFEVDPRSGTD